MRLTLVGVLLLLTIPAAAQKPSRKFDWKPGRVIVYSYESGTKTIPYTHTDLSVDVTDSRRTEQRDIIARDDHLRMQIRTEDGLYYVNQNLKYIWQAKLDIKEGDTVDVRAKDGRIRIRTAKGKKAKYIYLLFVPKEFDTGN